MPRGIGGGLSRCVSATRKQGAVCSLCVFWIISEKYTQITEIAWSVPVTFSTLLPGTGHSLGRREVLGKEKPTFDRGIYDYGAKC